MNEAQKMANNDSNDLNETHNEAAAEVTGDNSAPETAPAAPAGPDAAEQLAATKDQLLRALAEVENIRRRSQKEREDTAKYAVGNFAKEMLGMADNFARALAALPKDGIADEALRNLVTGIQATERHLLASFEKFGVRAMNPIGQPFDPNFHQVMMEVEDPAHATGTVVQVLQTGYMIHDRLLREALVAVSKGGGATVHKLDTSA